METDPEVPDGRWYKDFGSFKLSGEGQYPKTFLTAGQAAKPVQITIRNVPDDVRDELAARAALEGKSMQEFLRSELVAPGRLESTWRTPT